MIPAMSPPALKCHVLDTGYCTASEHHLVTTGRKGVRVRCHSIAAVLRHPTHGWFLWDTGYAPRILNACRAFPFQPYRWVTQMVAPAELAVVHQLARLNLDRDDIRYIVLSHFHADHVAGLRDFASAIPVATRDAWTAVRDVTGLRALARAFVPALIPEDFDKRATFIDHFTGPIVAPFGPSHDLFADGSTLVVPLPGHARGQVGLLARTDRGPIFFAADSCWMSTSIRDRTLPHAITRFVVDDWGAVRDTIHRVADFSQAHPDIAIVPSHCPEAFQTFVRSEARS